MKRRALALCLAALLLLSGCSAMLNRNYRQVAPHEERPAMADDDDVYEPKNYADLLNAVLLFVTQGEEEGSIRIRIPDYQPRPNGQEDVPGDVQQACVEVAEIPVANYAVNTITAACTRVINTYEVTVSVDYRRSQTQIRSIKTLAGSGAVRKAIQETLSTFSPELVFKAGYYAADAEIISGQFIRAYYDTPAAALGMPQISVKLYPEQGTEHVVEILFTYPEDTAALREKSSALIRRAAAISASYAALSADAVAQDSFAALRRQVNFLPDGEAGGGTAHAALVERAAHSEGVALAFQLLSENTALESTVVRGILDGRPHFWNLVRLEDGEYRHVDATMEDGLFRTDGELLELGYQWDRDDSSYHTAGPAVDAAAEEGVLPVESPAASENNP